MDSQVQEQSRKGTVFTPELFPVPETHGVMFWDLTRMLWGISRAQSELKSWVGVLFLTKRDMMTFQVYTTKLHAVRLAVFNGAILKRVNIMDEDIYYNYEHPDIDNARLIIVGVDNPREMDSNTVHEIPGIHR